MQKKFQLFQKIYQEGKKRKGGKKSPTKGSIHPTHDEARFGFAGNQSSKTELGRSLRKGHQDGQRKREDLESSGVPYAA